MASMTKIKSASMTALKDYLGLAEDETLLVVCDEGEKEIGEVMFECGKEICQEAIYVEMKSRKFNGEEPPEPIATMMQQVDAVICPTSKSLTHTRARREASKVGVRVATMPGISVDTLVRCMAADHERIVELTNNVAEKLKGVKTIRIETKSGTDISIPVFRRKVIASTGVLRTIGESGNLPSGEVYVAPWEDKTNGKIVIDGSMAELGIIQEPILIDIKDGYIVNIEGGEQAEDLKKILDRVGDPDAKAVAEFGLGTNYKARIIGEILEDEKVLGTVHIAFGNNVTMGGKITVPSHIDGIIMRPNIYFDDELIMGDGRLLI
jgi:aminopeptidase